DGAELVLLLEIPDPMVLRARKIDLDMMAKLVVGNVENKEAVRELIEAYTVLRARKPVRQTRLTLDSEKGYAIKQREDRTADGELIQTIDCADLELMHPDGLWLPR